MANCRYLLTLSFIILIYGNANANLFPTPPSQPFDERVDYSLIVPEQNESIVVARETNTDTTLEEAEEDTESDDSEFDDEFESEFEAEALPEVYDPLIGYNRFMTNVNDKLYFYLLKPVAKGYRFVVPEAPRKGLYRFFENLLFPIRFVNNLLQVKFKNAGEEFLRFGINSTIGLLGFFDPAKNWFNLDPHEEDFGQTLGFYGVGSGIHIVLPILGPSNLRDMLSMYPDFYLDPVTYMDNELEEYGVRYLKVVNYTSIYMGEYESTKKDAFDLYPFMRDMYEQNRIKKIKE